MFLILIGSAIAQQDMTRAFPAIVYSEKAGQVCSDPQKKKLQDAAILASQILPTLGPHITETDPLFKKWFIGTCDGPDKAMWVPIAVKKVKKTFSDIVERAKIDVSCDQRVVSGKISCTPEVYAFTNVRYGSSGSTEFINFCTLSIDLPVLELAVTWIHELAHAVSDLSIIDVRELGFSKATCSAAKRTEVKLENASNYEFFAYDVWNAGKTPTFTGAVLSWYRCLASPSKWNI